MPAPPRPKPDCDALAAELYRGVLGREPDAGGLAHYSALLAGGATLSTLLRDFIGSDEFRAFTPPDPFIHLRDDPPLPIELALSPQQLAALWAHIASTWTLLGDEDPYWSVLSAPRFRRANMTDSAMLENFYATGGETLQQLESWLGRNGLALRPDAVCAEYGCGVGRLSGFLAARCRMLHAFDISPRHLDLARTRMKQAGHRNIVFHTVRKPADLARLGGADLFISDMVLQHNPPPIIGLILGEAFRLLNAGGIACFQLPTYMHGYSFDLETYLAGIAPTNHIEMHCLPQHEVFALAAQHGLVPLELQQDDKIGRLGVSHTFLFRKQG